MESTFGGTMSQYEMPDSADSEAEEFLLCAYKDFFVRIKDYMFLENPIRNPTLLELALTIEAEYYSPQVAPLRTEFREPAWVDLPATKSRLDLKIENIHDARVRKQVQTFLNQPFMGYAHVASGVNVPASQGSNLISMADDLEPENPEQDRSNNWKPWRTFE